LFAAEGRGGVLGRGGPNAPLLALLLALLLAPLLGVACGVERRREVAWDRGGLRCCTGPTRCGQPAGVGSGGMCVACYPQYFRMDGMGRTTRFNEESRTK
jgi:hypothetical protein